MAKRVWIAQSKLTCYRCKKPILPGHRYVWEQTKIGSSIGVQKVHPECKEEK